MNEIGKHVDTVVIITNQIGRMEDVRAWTIVWFHSFCMIL